MLRTAEENLADSKSWLTPIWQLMHARVLQHQLALSDTMIQPGMDIAMHEPSESMDDRALAKRERTGSRTTSSAVFRVASGLSSLSLLFCSVIITHMLKAIMFPTIFNGCHVIHCHSR